MKQLLSKLVAPQAGIMPFQRSSSGLAAMVQALVFFCALLLLFGSALQAQQFTRITDPGNPIAAETEIGPGGYGGASWIDYDGDEDLDLYVNNVFLYRNEGGGQFTRISGSGLASASSSSGIGHGNSWADVDNDGDMDCFIVGALPYLYVNNGDGTFSAVTSGEIGAGVANRGWSCAWADVDNNGFVDLLITHPAGFVPGGAAIQNSFFLNNGNLDFTKVAPGASDVTTGLAPYTVGTFSDFDQDGDQDLFIGSGPASGTPAPDYLYKNMLKETGTATLERITSGAIAADPQDGQVWNWVDYDNDGDLDGFLSNYGAAFSRLYRNDNGTYVRQTALQAGTLVSDVASSLANIWADFDNDGDQDVYITNDGGTPAFYYVNNGNGSFTRDTQNAIVGINAQQCGATAGDYDRDGDLDLFVYSITPAARGLYRNESQGNGNKWVNIRAEGVVSNRAAIGTQIRARATINGQPVWQIREVSAQNSFNSQNSLNVHFGLGDAGIIDSLVISWPSDTVETFVDLPVNRFYAAVEGQGLMSLTGLDPATTPLATDFRLHANFPNPFNPETHIGYTLKREAVVDLVIYNTLGQEVRRLSSGTHAAGEHSVIWDARDNAGNQLVSGVYLYRMIARIADGSAIQSTRKMVLLK